ncbi:MAG: UvrD-helicase domain-containing protein, partial [Desulfovibrionaceae bacterium]|nr:UvrD-helicase domain-containing protein [Desulfovibrionaceae bacterium]
MVTYGITQIKASAGSGKTYTLTQLFLHSLASITAHNGQNKALHYGLRDIIAMTFTNKAVEEMKTSVLNKLKATALGIESEQTILQPSQASLWMDTILEHYTSLRIQSIDSTLLQLLRSISLSLGLPSNCKPLLDTDEKHILSSLYTQYIQQSLHDNDIMSTIEKACNIFVSESVDSSTFHIVLKDRTLDLVKMILERGMFLDKTQDEIDEIVAFYEKTIATLNSIYGQHVQATHFNNTIKKIRDDIEQHNIIGIHSNFVKALESASYYSKKDSAMFKKDSFYDVLKQDGQKAIDESTLAYMNGLYGQLKKSIQMKETIVSCIRIASQVAPLVKIACSIVAMLNEYQKREGIIVFSSIPSLLSQYFSSPNGIYEALNHVGMSIHTIFFDEFQDTSRAQWYSLAPLIENVLDNNGSFIYVGDVKQAIYAWRGGDSSLFESIYTEMNYEKRKNTLDSNWRSAEPIVRLANIFSEMEEKNYARKFFYALLSEKTQKSLQQRPHIEEQAIQKLIEAYTKGQQKISVKTQNLQGRIRITELLHEKATKDSTEDSEEENLTEEQKIREELYSSLLERLSYAQHKDIAILTRTNNEATLVSQWLLEWNIPYTIEGGIELHTVPLIQHIILMLRFIHTQSSSSLYAVLYSLLCRDYIISEEECIRWRLRTKDQDMISAFKASHQDVWNTYFEPFISHYTTYTPYQYIQECIRCFSLYDRFPQCELYLDFLLEIAFQSDAMDTTSIAKFLAHFETYKEQYKVTPSEQANAIQILSIHKSKGLEFPIVYLPFTKAPRKHNTRPLSIYTIGDILEDTAQHNDEIESLLDIPIFTQVTSNHTLYYIEYIDTAIE